MILVRETTMVLAVLLIFVCSCGNGTAKNTVDQTNVPDETVTDTTTTTDEAITDETFTDEPVTDEAFTDEPSTDETEPDETVSDDVPIDEEQPDEDTAAGFTFNGQWAMLNFTTANVETTIPGLGKQTSVSTTAAYALVGLMDNGDGTVSATGITCDMEINSGSNLIEIIISDNYIAHLAPTLWDFSLLPDRRGNGYDVSATDVLTMNGLKDFNDPMHDPLPTNKNDPHVWDQDEDGHPGMTVDCIGHIPVIFNGPGTMYTVQRTIITMVGETTDADRIEGMLMWESEQVVLEASNNVLMNEKTITPDYANSWFKMVRVDDAWTCAEVKAHKDTLFPGK